MTDAQKEQVRAMRMQGIGYRLIAKSLGLRCRMTAKRYEPQFRRQMMRWNPMHRSRIQLLDL